MIPPGIVTTGEATVRVKPDAAIVTVGAIVQAPTAGKAQAQVTDRVAKLLERARALGIPEEKIKTIAVRIDPQYAFDQGKAPRLIGYQGQQHIALSVPGTDMVGRVLDDLVGDESANTASVAFTLLDRKAAEAAAREQAIQDARSTAQAMARSAGVTLGRLLSINDLGRPAPFGGAFETMALAAPRGAPPAGLPAGELEIVARVQVQFEIV